MFQFFIAINILFFDVIKNYYLSIFEKLKLDKIV